MTPRVLFVDDDPNILDAFQRQLRKVFALETAAGVKRVEAVRARGPFAVIVSDLRMPKMDGIQFLARVRETAPDSVRMMLTGNADLQTAIEAVNEGNIFRFLTKPCESHLLIKAVADGIRQHQLVVSERELLQKTLRGSLKVLSEILQLINPEAFGRASRITHYAKEVGKIMRVSDLWQLETAAALSQIGCVILPEKALKKLYQGRGLTGEEKQLFEMHPFIASDLLMHIPRMQGVAEIITYQEKYFDGSGIPQDSLRGKEIPLPGRILKVVLDFDTQQAGGATKSEAVERMSAPRAATTPKSVGTRSRRRLRIRLPRTQCRGGGTGRRDDPGRGRADYRRSFARGAGIPGQPDTAREVEKLLPQTRHKGADPVLVPMRETIP